MITFQQFCESNIYDAKKTAHTSLVSRSAADDAMLRNDKAAAKAKKESNIITVILQKDGSTGKDEINKQKVVLSRGETPQEAAERTVASMNANITKWSPEGTPLYHIVSFK